MTKTSNFDAGKQEERVIFNQNKTINIVTRKENKGN